MIFEKIKMKYQTMPIVTRTSLIYMICSVLQRGISFIAVPVYTRIVPAEEYGLYAVYQSWLMIVTIFATLNMWNYVYNNGMIKYKNRKEDFTSALIGLSTVITIIVFAFICAFYTKFAELSGLSGYLFGLMFVEILFRPGFEYWYARQRFEYNIKPYVIASLGMSIAQPFFCITFVVAAQKILDGFSGNALLTGKVFSAVLVYICICYFLLKRNHAVFDWNIWKFALKFNLPLIPHFLAGVILQNSDRIMIARMCGNRPAAIYSIAYSAGMVLFFVNEALISSIIPWTYKRLENRNYSGFTKMAAIIVGVIALINILLSFCAPEIIRIMAPIEYQEAIYIIPPVAISSVYMCLFNIYANIEYYYEETKLVAVASSASAIINIILNYIFIKEYGYLAAGYTTVACYIAYAAFHLLVMLYVKKKHGIEVPLFNHWFLWGESIVATTICIGVIFLYPYPFIRYLIISLSLIIVVIKRQDIINVISYYKK